MEYKLKDLVEIKYGKNQKNVKNSNGVYPILGTGGVMDYADDFLYDKPSVLIGRKGSIGKVKYIEKPFWTIDTLFYTVVKENLVLPKYLYYKLSQIDFNYYNEGTTIPSLRTETLYKISLDIPNIKTQKNVVKVLSNIDWKIELNQKIIANLQELSQTLFKHWFVDFEFPNENGNPYKSSGGEMVDSELGKIPKGWECVYLKDIVHHKKDTFNPKKSNESEVKHFSLPAFDSGQYPTIDYVTDIKSNKWIIDENCILFSKMNPTTRRIWVTLYNENFLNVASSEFVVLKSDSSYRNAFIYNICISDKFNEYLVSNTTGSTNSRQRVKPDIAVQYRFAYNEEVSYLLSEKIEPYIEKIKIIREQNQNLTQLRDTLLPKLMSGEIEIPDDIEVNEDELSI
ncbi:restriction endonuclease subunit S [Staphylococcus pseudintermedius]|nr:restriction endonuclease subunit S [Staphylococcus pseudintermedius]EGQ1663080.1 restriction endonuclease subunit S [Staphylococcus pseudintermedius]EGQ3366046.1 restriction endonuclease subunit S [Staphylococcus pseudintermedius]EGQ3998778.1 restriction endonuclease subunit S [Staphylococcus pseudintermedius]EGQ4048821.1 restriction endonuclease subunit S [Staphylococcus pseudintermedius]